MKSVRGPAAGLVVVVFAVLTIACVGLQSPEGWASPVISDDSALIFQKHERLSSVRIEDGRIVQTNWTFPNDNDESQEDLELRAVYRAPVFDGSSYYLAGLTGLVAALNLNGIPEWVREVRGEIVSGVVLAGDSLYLGTSNGELIRLSTADGHTVRTWELDDEIWAPPVIIGGAVYAATMSGTLYGFDIESGEQLWAPIESSSAVPELMSVNDELLFAPSLSGTVRIYDSTSGQTVGVTFNASDWVWSQAAVQGTILYFGDFGGRVYALDISTFQTVWEYDAETKVKATPVIIGDSLLVVTEEAVVHFLELATGDFRNAVPLANAGTVRATPAVDGELAYIIGTKGRLFRADPASFSVREVLRPGD